MVERTVAAAVVLRRISIGTRQKRTMNGQEANETEMHIDPLSQSGNRVVMRDGRQQQRGEYVLHDPSATSKSLQASAALPDANSLALDGVLTAEVASVLGVLGDLHLPDLLTQGSTITGAVLADNTDLPGALGLSNSPLSKAHQGRSLPPH